MRYQRFLDRHNFESLLEVSTVPVTCAKSVIRHSNDKLTGAKDGGNDSDRNHLRPSEAPGYMALFQPFGI
jgi:hypothetical protein